MKKLLTIGVLAGLGGLAAAPVRAQAVSQPVPTPQPVLTVTPSPAPSDEQSYRRETVFGINFNTQGGLIGGVNVRSARVMNNNMLWFWSLEGVFFKNPKEESIISDFGGTFTAYKTNYAFALRPSIGIQRILFHKAAESGVQVNGLLSAGPSLGLLMPYYIYYDYTARDGNGRPVPPQDIRAEQYDPAKHPNSDLIVDRAPLFSGINETKPRLGAHLRGALNFEYGRYKDAVAGVETGFLLEAYPKELPILKTVLISDKKLNNKFFPSVYLTIYLGHRS